MRFIYEHLFIALWLVWGVYWLIAARNVKQATRMESPLSRAGHVVPLVIAALLLWWPWHVHDLLFAKLLPRETWMFWAGAAITAAGLLFTVWARVHLAGNWSGVVTLKQDHELITSGPYRLVRHPVYTGLLLAFVGTGVAQEEWRSVLAVAIVAAALWRKLRLEEKWLGEQFGETYTRYRQRVKALIPFVI
jgi:protein-S-isoprenylcysteine O-methyltransferase Ste14